MQQNKLPLRFRIFTAVGAVMALTVAVYILYAAGLPEEAESPVGSVRPFTADTLQGGTITVDETSSRPLILNFWVTWCVPCVIEMPRLQQAFDKYRSDGLVVVGINAGQEDSRDAEAFAISQEINFPMVMDDGRMIENLYDVRGVLPTTVFIDEQGNIQEIIYGVLTEDSLSEGLGKIGLR